MIHAHGQCTLFLFRSRGASMECSRIPASQLALGVAIRTMSNTVLRCLFLVVKHAYKVLLKIYSIVPHH